MEPADYFRRQCFISADTDDPGIEWVANYLGNDTIVTATDFSHPEGRAYPQAIERILELPLSNETKEKIMWDNPARLYSLS